MPPVNRLDQVDLLYPLGSGLIKVEGFLSK
jgi:hypothetical protein